MPHTSSKCAGSKNFAGIASTKKFPKVRLPATFSDKAYLSDTLFSADVTLYYDGDEFHPDTDIYNYICYTYDLRTGNILGLGDILDMEALGEMIRTEGVLLYPEGMGKLKGPTQETLDWYSDFIIDQLNGCRDPSIKTFLQPTFALSKDRIWFYDIIPGPTFPAHTYLFVKLEDIRHILKVDL